MNLEKAFLFFRVSPVHVRDDMGTPEAEMLLIHPEKERRKGNGET